MKRSLLIISTIFISVFAFSQLSLSYKNNAPSPGDSVSIVKMQYLSPGNGGSGQIWDFSKATLETKPFTSKVTAFPQEKYPDATDCNVLVEEDGVEYMYKVSENLFEEKGYTKKNIVYTFSEPVIKMKYPFTYNQSYSGKFKGKGDFKGTAYSDVSGDYTITADGHGTLILPSTYYSDVLRVKVEKNVLEISHCGSVETHSTRYVYYAPGMKYPVLNISANESQKGGNAPVVINTACMTIQKGTGSGFPAGVSDQNSMNDQDFSVMVFPNPFTDKLTYNYFLRKPMVMEIELFDVTGRNMAQILKRQTQGDGIHNGEIDASYGLSEGVYYIRFTFDKKVFTSKVVKM